MDRSVPDVYGPITLTAKSALLTLAAAPAWTELSERYCAPLRPAHIEWGSLGPAATGLECRAVDGSHAADVGALARAQLRAAGAEVINDGDAERPLALSLMPARDDHRLRRARLPEVPGAEVHAVGGRQLDLLVVGLELEWGEGEVVEPDRLRRQERSPVELVGEGEKEDQKSEDGEAGESEGESGESPPRPSAPTP